jgi:hypothetical protein
MNTINLGALMILGPVIAFAVGLFVLIQLYKLFFGGGSKVAPLYIGGKARLPCLANKQCPGGLKCSGGFCSEGFMAPVLGPAVDMSSCTAKECKGIDAPCSRKAQPCPEGTFCQNDNCVNIAAPDQGEAYNQIGGLL